MKNRFTGVNGRLIYDVLETPRYLNEKESLVTVENGKVLIRLAIAFY